MECSCQQRAAPEIAINKLNQVYRARQVVPVLSSLFFSANAHSAGAENSGPRFRFGSDAIQQCSRGKGRNK